MDTDTISTQHTDSSTGFGIRPSMVESWLPLCVTLNKLMTLWTQSLYQYMDTTVPIKRVVVGLNELRCIKLIAVLAYSRCWVKNSFQYCDHHWVSSAPSVLCLEMSAHAGPWYMNFRSSGRVGSPQRCESATTWLRPGNEGCKTEGQCLLPV